MALLELNHKGLGNKKVFVFDNELVCKLGEDWRQEWEILPFTPYVAVATSRFMARPLLDSHKTNHEKDAHMRREAAFERETKNYQEFRRTQ